MNDKKQELYTIVYTIQLSNTQLFGDNSPYVAAQSPEPEITEFNEANDVIARIKAAL